jgi:protein O-mannosyl-transferase
VICAGLAFLTLAVFARAFHYPFITYDDRLYVSENPHVLGGLTWSNVLWAFTTWHTGNWHPLTWLSLIVDAQFFGNNAGGFHLTNVLLHMANSVLLFLVLRQLTAFPCRRLGGDAGPSHPPSHSFGVAGRGAATAEWQSAFVAALFAVHPVHVESVAWISERKDVLSALLFLLALGAYGRYVTQSTTTRYAALMIFFVFGLLAKSMLVTLPFVLLLLDFWPLQRIRGQKSDAPPTPGSGVAGRGQKNWSALILEKLPLFVVAAIFSFVTFLAQRSAGSTMPMTVFPFRERVENALVASERYLAKLFWPRDLTLPYPFSRSINPWELGWAVVLLIAITCVAIKTARERGYLLTGWLWFLGMLVPVIGLVQVGPQAMADRYMYLPAIGIFIAIACASADAATRMRLPASVTAAFSTAVLFVLGWLCVVQLGYWRNSETLFQHTLAVHAREIVSLRNLASAYALERRPRDAIVTLELLLTERPQDAGAHFHLAQALQQIGGERRAAGEYEAALRFARESDKRNVTGSALNNLAWIRATSSDPALRDGAGAVRLAERSCALSPNPDAGQLDTLAAAYAEVGDFGRAIDTAERGLQLAESAGNKALAAQISEHVDLYRERRPLRETARP